ncbi:MAG TPA: hypothetical protein PLE92_03380 [Lentisphaeria bacterium]|nr:hypothetical protein [Lentisphaeria bacterium]
MRKNIISLAAAMTLVLSAAPAWSQAEQRTVVRKTIVDNPSIGVAVYEGSPASRAKLESVLTRCGWFRMMPAAQASSAQIQIFARCQEVGGKAAIVAKVKGGGKEFDISFQEASVDLVVYAAVDEILKQLYQVPALCARKIVFVMTGQNGLKELFSCYLDGGGLERLTHNDSYSTEPSWGHQHALVYTMAKNNALSVVLMDVGKNRQRVVSKARGLNASAALSRDGRYVALAMSEDNRVDLYMLDLATNAKTRLTNDQHVESSPCWSPNGEEVCFVSDKLGVPQIYLMSASGGAARRLSVGGNECVSPDWSRVTNRLCYSKRSNTGQYVIEVRDMGKGGGAPEAVTVAAGDWEAPSWAPDGRHLVCTRRSGRSRDLYMVDTWLKAFWPITKNADFALPAWTPAR